METPVIWKKFVINGRRIVSSEDIRKLARELGKDEWRSLTYLQVHGYIVRILRGIFYVRSPDERERGTCDASVYEMVALALDMKGVNNWYYGLETALRFNLMTHEYYNIDFVVTDSYRTTKTIRILDANFRFLRRNNDFFGFGMTKGKNYLYSDPEKTVLDISHAKYLRSKEPAYYLSPVIEYQDGLDMERFREYLRRYSRRFQASVEVGI